jgi:ElaA protein
MKDCLSYLRLPDDNWIMQFGSLQIKIETVDFTLIHNDNTNHMIRWCLKKFEELTPYELYAIVQLRNEVFVVEQNCVFQDADNKDQLSYHLMGWSEERLIAYSRIIPAGIAYELASIGRVVTAPDKRRNGTGRELMNEALKATATLFGKVSIKLGAQLYLKNFYESFGFSKSSDIYIEDGIPHIEMIRK